MISYKKCIVIVFLSIILILHVSVFAQQKRCIFISTTSPADPNDQPLVDGLQLVYDVEVWSIDDIKSGFVDTTYMKNFDFLFVSESLGSSDLIWVRGPYVPIPLFTTELWGSKQKALGWVPNNNEGNFGSTEEGQHIVTIVDGSHSMAAGFATGTEIDIVTPIAGSVPLTYSVPSVEYLPIATLKADPNKVIAMGVEVGTLLETPENMTGDLPEGTDVQKHRAAAVGIMASHNISITEDGYKLIHAAIDWITGGGGTPVGKFASQKSDQFSLSQNFPNPFNPTTFIHFTLQQSQKISLKVYDISGREVASLIDAQDRAAGSHTITFNASNLTSGIYMYQLETESHSETKRMLLVK